MCRSAPAHINQAEFINFSSLKILVTSCYEMIPSAFSGHLFHAWSARFDLRRHAVHTTVAILKRKKSRAMGRVKKISGSPPDIISPCRKYTSAMGPRINAIKRAAGLSPHFFNKYPNTPKKTITFTSNIFWCVPYAPIPQRIKITGKR